MFSDFILFINSISRFWSDFIIREIIFATILFLIIWPLTQLLKNRSPYWKYGLWTLLFIRLMLPINFSLPGNVWQYVNDFNLLNWISLSSVSNSSSNFEVDLSILTEQKANQQNYMTEDVQPMFDTQLLRNFLYLFWFTGFILALFIFNRKRKQFKNIILYSQLVRDVKIKTISQNWKKLYELKRQIKIYASDKYLSPYTIGIIRPNIFIPQAILDANNPIMLKAIIGHEMAHIKRYDALWIQLQFFIQAFFFFYPIVWFASRHLNLAREGICDQMVLQHKLVLPKQYAGSLIQILQLNSIGAINWPYAPAFKTNKHALKLRINQIMENNVMNKKQIFTLIVFFALLGFITLPMASILDDQKLDSEQPILPKNSVVEHKFVAPIKIGKIASGFGQRLHPFKKVLMHHNGVDIAAPEGTEVHAIANGIVDYAGLKDDWGKKIVLLHKNDYGSIYGQLSEILVEKGMQVKAGQLIGLVGNSGMATAPHLHFELRINNEPLNPENLIDFSSLQSIDK